MGAKHLHTNITSGIVTCLLFVCVRVHLASAVCPESCLCFKETVRCMFLQLDHIPQIPNDTTVLDLRFNRIRDIPPNSFRGLTQLNTLLLNNNNIREIGKDSFAGLEGLQYLYLYKNKIRKIHEKAFAGLSNLQQLYIHFNEIDDVLPNTFKSLAKLERLFLHNNQIKTLPPGLFSDLRDLRRLRLDSNAFICDCQMMWIKDMVQQTFADIALTCEGPSEVRGRSLMDLTMDDLHCKKPTVTSVPRDLEVTFGATALFTCTADGDPSPEIIWKRDNEDLMAMIHDPDSRYNMLDDGSLRIDDITNSDAGVYECIARNPAGEASANAVLRTDTFGAGQYSERPEIVIAPKNYNVNEGETVTLECRVTGHPEPQVSWTKDDRPVSLGDHIVNLASGALEFRGVRFADTGVYECTANNIHGSTSTEAKLVVLAKPQFTRRPESKTVVEGLGTFFTCEADGNPQPIINWLRNGQILSEDYRVTFSEDKSTLWISEVIRRDQGIYVCEASNNAGVAVVSVQLLVNVQVAPVIRIGPRDAQAVLGTNVVFQCTVQSDPPSSITWFKDGAVLATSLKYDIQTGEQSLLVRNITARDQGVYECLAQNSIGADRAAGRLDVYDNRFNEILIDNDYIRRAVEDSRTVINRAINSTIRELYDTSQVRTPEQLLALFKFPNDAALDISRSTEVFERTLQTLYHDLHRGMMYNISYKSSSASPDDEILNPAHISLIANLSNCAAYRQKVNCDDMCFHQKYRTFDGTCNNLRHPMWGSSLTALNRLLPASYENGFNAPKGWDPSRLYNGHTLPNARLVSLELASTSRITPDTEYTHMLMQWGQFIDHDLDFVPMAVSNARFSDGRHCNESCDNTAPCFPIPVPATDPRITRRRCIGVTRSSAMCGSGMTSVFFKSVIHREQINQLTSYMDGSNVYGSSEDEANNLRDFATQSGYLRSGYIMPSGKPLLPPNNGEPVDCQRESSRLHVPCFQAGDHRVNEQLGLTAMHTLWMREHNRVASELRRINVHWDGDTLYHEARKIVGAQMQHITHKHWLPIVLGPEGMQLLGNYSGYDPHTDASVTNEFATAAFRFGHSLINPVLTRLDARFQPILEGNLPLHKAFFAPFRIVEEGGIDPLIRGLFASSAKKLLPGELMNTELTEKLFKLAHEVALDLAALNIQRGRDHGLQSYNALRKYCGLRAAEGFDDFSREIRSAALRRKLAQVYGHPDNVDPFIGGMSEDTLPGAKIGPTFVCILAEQFRRSRDGDRFWYENPEVFKPSQLVEIQQASLARVICDNSDNITHVQKNVFSKTTHNSEYLPCSSDLIPEINLQMWASCCSDCESSGNFYSVTSGFRHSRPAPNQDNFPSQRRGRSKRSLRYDDLPSEVHQKIRMLQNQGVSQQHLDEFINKQRVMLNGASAQNKVDFDDLPNEMRMKVRMMRSQGVSDDDINEFVRSQLVLPQPQNHGTQSTVTDTNLPADIQQKVQMMRSQGISEVDIKQFVNKFIMSTQSRHNVHDLPADVQTKIQMMVQQGVDENTIQTFIQKQRMMLQSTGGGSQSGKDRPNSTPISQSGAEKTSPSSLEDVVHMSHSMMDSVDNRIEGIEVFINDMQKTIDTLKRKLSLQSAYQIRRLETRNGARPTLASVASTDCLDYMGLVHHHRDRWSEGDCRNCTCKIGTSNCYDQVCALPTCTRPTKVAGQCCPVC